jgi:excisionase family DNA binding protein
MPNPTIILQPTAPELLKFLQMSANDSNTSVKLTVEITQLSEEMSVNEVLEALDCSKKHLYNLGKANKLKPYRFEKNRRRFKRSEVMQLINNHDTAA